MKEIHGGVRALMWSAFCLVSVAISIPSSMAETKGPKATIPESIYDFGTVAQGQRVVHDFEIRNDGDTDLVIQQLAPSCGCTASTVSSSTVKPGATEKIHVDFDTSGFSGSKSKSVHLVTNSVERPETIIKLVGTIVRGVTVNPERLEFGEMSASSSTGSRVREFTVQVQEGAGLAISSVTTFSKYISVTPIRSEPGKGVYSAELLPGAPKGELRDRVIVNFKDDSRPGLNIPVTASIVGDLRVVPSTVSFGLVGGSEVLERRVRFENNSSMKVSIDKIVTSDPAISASVVDIEPGKKGVLVIKLEPQKLNGDLRATIDLETSHPTERQLSLSVYGVQPPR